MSNRHSGRAKKNNIILMCVCKCTFVCVCVWLGVGEGCVSEWDLAPQSVISCLLRTDAIVPCHILTDVPFKARRADNSH